MKPDQGDSSCKIKYHNSSSILSATWWHAQPSLLSLLLLLSVTIRAAASDTQTFTTLHNFTNGPDGGEPIGGVTIDRAGNFYGTASTGGNTSGSCDYPNPPGCGTVFKLLHKNSGWITTPIYTFNGPDGRNPLARVIIGPDGSLFGTTSLGGDYDHGVVFNLRPPASACKTALCPWTETVLFSFQGATGADPTFGDLTFDAAGNLYGTTPHGGQGGRGVVYELTPSNGGWTETVLYSFQSSPDGNTPYGGIVFDQAGNIWGTTGFGGTYNNGTIYELVPSSGSWTENVVYNFYGATDGANPYAGLIVDAAGNFFGATFGYNGTTPKVFELSPSNGSWRFSTLYSLGSTQGAIGNLIMDAAHNLYGTTYGGLPEVYRLAPADGSWTLTGSWGGVGSNPSGAVTMDSSGNLYTTTQDGGTDQLGVVFEITP